MTVKLVPLPGHIIVRPIQNDMAGILHLPQTALKMQIEGLVVAAAKMAKSGKHEMEVKLGMRVLLHPNAGQMGDGQHRRRVEVDGHKCWLLAETDVLGILTA